jgi:hypothetical protein
LRILDEVASVEAVKAIPVAAKVFLPFTAKLKRNVHGARPETDGLAAAARAFEFLGMARTVAAGITYRGEQDFRSIAGYRPRPMAAGISIRAEVGVLAKF